MTKALLPLLLIVTLSATAQRIKVLRGDLKTLKGQQTYDIKFTYDSMLVGAGIREKVYLTEMKERWEQKEPGKGSDFVQMWFDDRVERYEPAFIKNFEEYSNVKLNDKNAKYLMIVKTTHTEGGWNLGISSHPGEIDGELWIVEAANPENIIGVIGFREIGGKYFYGGDFEMTARIEGAYAVAGRWVGDLFRKKSK